MMPDSTSFRDQFFSFLGSQDYGRLDFALRQFDACMIAFVTLVGLWLILRRRINWPVVGGAFLVSLIAGDRLFFWEKDFGKLAYLIWPRWGMANSDTHRYVLLMLVALVLSAMIAWKRWRNIDRILWAWVSWVMMATTIIFHIYFVHADLMTVVLRRVDDLKAIAAMSDAGFDAACTGMKLYCERGAFVEGQSIAPPSKRISDDIRRENDKRSLFTDQYDLVYFTGNSQADGPYGAFLRRSGKSYRFLLDREGLQQPYLAVVIGFYAQAAFAYTIWTSLGLLLIYRHTRRFAKRAPGDDSFPQQPASPAAALPDTIDREAA
jgi:hypothetical protein